MMSANILTPFFIYTTGGAAANNGNHDARLLYMMELASCRALSRPQGARDERDCRGRYLPFA